MVGLGYQIQFGNLDPYQIRKLLLGETYKVLSGKKFVTYIFVNSYGYAELKLFNFPVPRKMFVLNLLRTLGMSSKRNIF